MNKLDWQSSCTSLQIRSYHRGNLSIDCQFGDKYSYYDIASLTKIVFTNSLILKLQSEGKIDIEKKLSSYLTGFHEENLSLRQLLTHCSGFDWWKSFYKELREFPDSQDIDFRTQWELLRPLLLKEVPKAKEASVYSDIDYLFLGLVLQDLTKKNLLELWNDFTKCMPMPNSFFSVNNICPVDRRTVAPTETCNWRNLDLQGVVHDENAYALGGVSTHAGLFSNTEDLGNWCLKIRNCLFEGDQSLWNTKLLSQAIDRQLPAELGDWGLGFMKPSLGKASCGKYFSQNSFGHTGFTGTSLWIDPDKDLIAIVLSNRVHPSRENKNFVSLRPVIHDEIFNSHFL